MDQPPNYQEKVEQVIFGQALSWDGTPANVDGCYVSYSTNTGSISGTRSQGSSQPLTMTFGGLDPGISYTFRVSAYNSVGESAAVTTAPGIPPLGLTAPSNLSALRGNTNRQINLSWSDGNSPTVQTAGFVVERSTGGGAFPQVGSTFLVHPTNA
jgi:hypothetical protein